MQQYTSRRENNLTALETYYENGTPTYDPISQPDEEPNDIEQGNWTVIPKTPSTPQTPPVTTASMKTPLAP